jgi:hypothetical protein
MLAMERKEKKIKNKRFSLWEKFNGEKIESESEYTPAFAATRTKSIDFVNMDLSKIENQDS